MKKLLIKKWWFTLLEVVIASVIWAIVFLWIIFFLTQINSDIAILENKSKVLNSYLFFQDKISKEADIYNEKHILVDGHDWFDIILLTNKSRSKWMLMWVIDNNPYSTWFLKLDNPQDNIIYGDKIIWLKYIDSSLVSSLINNPESSYNLVFDEKETFKDFKIVKFKWEIYNSWAIMELSLGMLFDYNKLNDWQKISSITRQDSLYSVNLDL